MAGKSGRKAKSLEQAKAQTRPRRTPKKKPRAKPKTKRLTAAQTVQRDTEVVRDRLVGDMSWTGIATKHGIDESTARRILARWRENNAESIDQVDATGELWETLQGLEAQLERLREGRERAVKQNNLNAELGFEGKMLDTRQAKVKLLQEADMLPKNLGTLKHVFEVRTVVQRVVFVLDRIEKGEIEPGEAKREVLALLAPSDN